LGRGMKIPSAAAAMGVLAETRKPPLELDVLQVHFGPMGVVVDALREMELVAGPMVVTFHGSDVSAWRRADPGRYDGLFARVDAITANSSFLRDRLLGLGAPGDRIIRLPMGVDLTEFAVRPPPGGPPRFLTVGRLSEEKGIEHALRAMALLRDRGRIFSYTIIGGGPLRSELESLARSLELEDRVHIRGPQPRGTVVAAMADHHILVQPGVEAASGAVEAQGLVLAEAQATGMPVVASDVGGIPETVGPGAGRLVPPGDPESLADALDALLRERDRWGEIGEAGRRHAEREFDRRALRDRLVDLYGELSDRT
ncbi:MAG: glycosyltransferase, partial [Longimicrobiales bacterium]|nr:glycosyltransferase [Longimicrobiales bacterium]